MHCGKNEKKNIKKKTKADELIETDNGHKIRENQSEKNPDKHETTKKIIFYRESGIFVSGS